MKITAPALQQAELCEPILRSLPEWFGIESAIQQFLVDIENLPNPHRLAGRTGCRISYHQTAFQPIPPRCMLPAFCLSFTARASDRS
jgi:hypothetical protein